MAIGSQFSSQSFSISYFERLPKGGNWKGLLDVSVEDWRHTVSAFGGFDTASFTLSESQIAVDEWIQDGLFRPIVANDNFLDVVWEGFVDSIQINQAGLSVTLGPVTAIDNRVFAIYSGVDTSVYPPQIGVRKKTPTVNDLTSQADWGIWFKILSLAGVSDANSDQLVSMWLEEHAQPDKDSNFSFTNEEISLTINCLGWYKTLTYPYNYTTPGTGTISISDRIKAVLNAHLNPGWISSDHNEIVTNASQVPLYENDDQLAMEHIRGVTAMGNPSNVRHYFGIYQNRKAVYGPGSDEIDYFVELADPRRLILDSGGSIVSPWRILPGKWVFFNDYLPGLGAPFIDYRRDPRMLRIESVQFDMRTPFAVQFNGGKSSRYEMRSARLGLRGTEV